MTINRTLSALAVVGPCAFGATAATAQQENPQLEFNCRHGVPVAEDFVKADMGRIQKTMDAYFALSAASAPKDIKAVFSDSMPGVSWQDGEQKVPLDQLASHLARPVETPRLVLAVTGGDNMTSRTIWAGRDANGPVFYAVDFTNGTWLISASILHMKISHGETAPETPPAYCHIEAKEYTGNLEDDSK